MTRDDAPTVGHELGPGEVWIDPDTGLGWTIVEIDSESYATLEAVASQRVEIGELRRLFRHDPHDHGW